MRMKARLFGLSICLLLGSSLSALAQTAEVQVTDVWARATPGGAQTAAIYATLQSSTGDELTGVSTPAAKEAQLHQMTMEGAVMKMRRVDRLELPAGQSVTLKPGGYHIMLVGLAHPLVDGQTFPMTFTFAKSGTQDVTVTVQKVGAMGPGDSPNMPGMNMPAHH
jgi:periplasmic copper chaperone A